MAADVHVLREYHAGGEINSIVWFAGIENPAGPLQKPHAGQKSELLQKMFRTA